METDYLAQYVTKKISSAWLWECYWLDKP